jgi:hypothetical protein
MSPPSPRSMIKANQSWTYGRASSAELRTRLGMRAGSVAFASDVHADAQPAAGAAAEGTSGGSSPPRPGSVRCGLACGASPLASEGVTVLQVSPVSSCQSLSSAARLDQLDVEEELEDEGDMLNSRPVDFSSPVGSADVQVLGVHVLQEKESEGGMPGWIPADKGEAKGARGADVEGELSLVDEQAVQYDVQLHGAARRRSSSWI